MKKRITLFALLMLGSLLIHAQTQLIPMNLNVGTSKQYVKSTQNFIDINDGIHVVYSTDMVEKSAKGTRGDVIIIFYDHSDAVTRNILACPEEFEYWDSFTDGENLISIYSVYDKKAKKLTLYTNTIDVNESETGWNPLELTDFSCEKRDYVHKVLSSSPDKSKSALLLCQVDKQSELKGAAIFTFGEAGERLWQSDLDLDLSQRTFSIIDMAVSNENIVYVGINSYSGKGSNISDASLHIYEVRESQTYNYSEATDFGYISNGRMLLNKAGNILIAGHYRSRANDHETGCYSAIFDVNTSNLASINHRNFPSSYKEKVVSKLFQNSIANQNCNVLTLGLYEFSNGMSALIGEVRGTMVVLQSNNQRSYVYQAKDIMFTPISVDGELSETQMLKKNQITSRYSSAFTFEQLGLSFKSVKADDKLYLIFNDHIDNYRGKNDVQYKCVPGKIAAGLYIIDANGETEKQLLLDLKLAKMNGIVPIYADENSIIVEAIDKKAVNISKINLSK